MTADLAHTTDHPAAKTGSAAYSVAAVAALLIVASAVLDITLMFFEPKAIVPGQTSAGEWLAMLHQHRILSLRNLGLLNVVNLLLEVPVFLALYDVHRRAQRDLAAVAVALLLVGAAVYIARNPVFSLDALASRYAEATTDADRGALLGATSTLLVLGEDLTSGAFMGFFVTELAGLVMALAMIRGRMFGRLTSITGGVGFGSLLVFNVFAAFAPTLYGRVLALGAIGGVVMIIWFVLVARGLVRLARNAGAQS